LIDSTASFILRTIERSRPTNAFFTYCCVMVEPPCCTPRARMFLMAARTIEVGRTPLCS
jgi:hypothetical protein